MSPGLLIKGPRRIATHRSAQNRAGHPARMRIPHCPVEGGVHFADWRHDDVTLLATLRTLAHRGVGRQAGARASGGAVAVDVGDAHLKRVPT